MPQYLRIIYIILFFVGGIFLTFTPVLHAFVHAERKSFKNEKGEVFLYMEVKMNSFSWFLGDVGFLQYKIVGKSIGYDYAYIAPMAENSILGFGKFTPEKNK